VRQAVHGEDAGPLPRLRARYSLFLCNLHALGFLRGKKVMCRVCRGQGSCRSHEI
jgi:hypothetical protein